MVDTQKHETVISYSKKQRCFHSESLQSYIAANIAALQSDRHDTGFKMIGIARSLEEESLIVKRHQFLKESYDFKRVSF